MWIWLLLLIVVAVAAMYYQMYHDRGVNFSGVDSIKTFTKDVADSTESAASSASSKLSNNPYVASS